MNPPDTLKDVMLDIETMSTRNNALVLSIGAVSFRLDPSGPVFGRRELWVPDPIEQLLMGRHVDPGTQAWWCKQPMEAREHWLHAANDRLPIGRTLNMFAEFLVPYERVWAQGIVFDIGILADLYGSTTIPVPWAYNAPRDARTLREFPELRKRPEDTTQVGAAHHPVYDCIEQVWDLWTKWPHLPVAPLYSTDTGEHHDLVRPTLADQRL